MTEHIRTHCPVIAQFLPVRFAVRERAEGGATIQIDVRDRVKRVAVLTSIRQPVFKLIQNFYRASV